MNIVDARADHQGAQPDLYRPSGADPAVFDTL